MERFGHFSPQEGMLRVRGCLLCYILPNSYTEPMERQKPIQRFRTEPVRPQEPAKATFMTGSHWYILVLRYTSRERIIPLKDSGETAFSCHGHQPLIITTLLEGVEKSKGLKTWAAYAHVDICNNNNYRKTDQEFEDWGSTGGTGGKNRQEWKWCKHSTNVYNCQKLKVEI